MLCRWNTKASTITKAQQLLAVPLEHQEAQANVSRRVTVYKTVAASEPHWSTAPLAPCRADTACKMSDNLPWACRATFESDSSLSRHLPLSPTPPLLSSTWAPLSYQRLAAKLASAAWLPGYRGEYKNVLNTTFGGVSTTSQRGSRRIQGRHSKAMTYFHLSRMPRSGSSASPVRPLPLSRRHRRAARWRLCCSLPRTWWQSRWQQSPPTFPGSDAFKCCSPKTELLWGMRVWIWIVLITQYFSSQKTKAEFDSFIIIIF